MDFTLSEEQKLLRDNAARFVQEHYGLQQRMDLSSSEMGFSVEHWRFFAEMGWLALPLPEAYGGLNGTDVDVAILMQQFGAGLVLEPYVQTVVLGGGLIAAAGSLAQQTAILPAIGLGHVLMGCAYLERQSRFDPGDVQCTARAFGDSYILDGRKVGVYYGSALDKLIVTARTAGESRDRAGITLFLVDAWEAGIERLDSATADGQRVSDFIFSAVTVGKDAVLGPLGGGLGVLERVLDRALCAHSAEAVGAMRRVYDTTREYLQVRQQFGQVLAEFQVLQHRLADLYIHTELSQSISLALAMRLADGHEEVPQLAALCKAKIGASGEFVGRQGVQLHGGVGMTEEYSVGHYYKRLMMIDVQYGSRDYHARRYETLSEP
ncbi:MAG: acyl-CoA dehydrogenase family protein [Pseudomonadota bacterium]